jgi:hypothetical protein
LSSGGKFFLGILALGLIAAAGLFVVMPGLTCFGRSCLSTGQFTNPITGQTTYNIYVDVVTSRTATGQVVLTPQITTSAPGTGEIVGSCKWIFCAIDGVSVSATIGITDTSTSGSVLSGTWNIRLGLNDHEEYIWLAPSLLSGHTYSVTITETVQTFTAGVKTLTSSATFTVPLQTVIAMPTASS